MSAPKSNEQATMQREVVSQGIIKQKRKRRISSYWSWFRDIGCKKFRHMHGREYDENREEDRKFVSELWDLDKQSWPMVEQHGRPSPSSHRSRSDQNPPTVESSWCKPRSNAIKAVSTCLPSTWQRHTTNNLQQLDGSTKRMLSTRDFMDKLKFSYLKLGHFPDFELRFLAVFPYIVAPSVNQGMLVYPAEISITHYTFKRGTISCWSSLINFDPNFLDTTGHLFHQITVEENAMVLGVPLMSTQGRCPSEVWRTFLTQYHKHGVVVCDADQMGIVDRALHFLASTVGTDQLQIHAEIMDKMITAQDFISALSKVYYDTIEKPLPDYLTDELIDLQFTNAREKVLDSSKCCDYHESKPPNHGSRQHCTVARATVLITAVCTLCFSGNLFNFRDLYDPEKHSVDSISVESPSLQTGDTMSKSTDDVLHDERAEVGLDASDPERLEEQSYRLHFEVVPPEEDPFLRQSTTTVDDLSDSISHLMANYSALSMNWDL